MSAPLRRRGRSQGETVVAGTKRANAGRAGPVRAQDHRVYLYLPPWGRKRYPQVPAVPAKLYLDLRKLRQEAKTGVERR
jgi:hypothetical protein